MIVYRYCYCNFERGEVVSMVLGRQDRRSEPVDLQAAPKQACIGRELAVCNID